MKKTMWIIQNVVGGIAKVGITEFGLSSWLDISRMMFHAVSHPLNKSSLSFLLSGFFLYFVQVHILKDYITGNMLYGFCGC